MGAPGPRSASQRDPTLSDTPASSVKRLVVFERMTTRLNRAIVSPLRLDTDAETSLDESCWPAAKRRTYENARIAVHDSVLTRVCRRWER